MMENIRSVVLFGYGKFGNTIADTLSREQVHILLVESNETLYGRAVEAGYAKAWKIDVTDDRHLEDLPINSDETIICAMDDDHMNVFLVLSLKYLYPKNRILAISDSIYATQKLKMAGADMVIDMYEVSAYRIHNILNKPIATRFLEGFMDHSHEYSFREMVIPENSFLDGMMLDDVDFGKYGVIFVGMIDIEKGNDFTFVTAGERHKLDSGDMIVLIGNDDDLDRLEEAISFHREVVLQ
jgi:voltage-gated potassium channel